jgi:predicted nucleic acid-binding Zn ribbon protein
VIDVTVGPPDAELGPAVRGYGGGVVDPVPISRSLDSVMKSLRGTDRIQIGGVFGRWDDAVGETVAAHVRPVRLDDGVLTVEADDAAWATQVKFLTSTIIDRLDAVAGVRVERVDVRVARSPRGAPRPEPTP